MKCARPSLALFSSFAFIAFLRKHWASLLAFISHFRHDWVLAILFSDCTTDPDLRPKICFARHPE